MSNEKCVRYVVKNVYIHRNNQESQRNTENKEVRDDYIRIKCLKSNGPRIFALKNVLAFEVVCRHAS